VSLNWSIDADPQQQEAASPLMLVVRSFLRYMALAEMRSASKTIARCARPACTGSTFSSEFCSQGPLERVERFRKGVSSRSAVGAALLREAASVASGFGSASGCSKSKFFAQVAQARAARAAVDGLQAGPLFGAMPLAVVRRSAPRRRCAVLAALAWRPASYNWSAHADAQHQEAASPQVLRSGGLRRWASRRHHG